MKLYNYFNICLIAQLATTSAAGSLRRGSEEASNTDYYLEEVSEQKLKATYVHAHIYTLQIKFKM